MITRKNLKIGTAVEMEHKNLFPKNLQKIMARRIAEQHLQEDTNYYQKLKKAKL